MGFVGGGLGWELISPDRWDKGGGWSFSSGQSCAAVSHPACPGGSHGGDHPRGASSARDDVWPHGKSAAMRARDDRW